VVCSNKEARKRLTESNGTPAMDLGHKNLFLCSRGQIFGFWFLFCYTATASDSVTSHTHTLAADKIGGWTKLEILVQNKSFWSIVGAGPIGRDGHRDMGDVSTYGKIIRNLLGSMKPPGSNLCADTRRYKYLRDLRE